MAIGLLLIRAVVGTLVAGHGAQKLFGWFGGHGLDGTGRSMESMGLRPGRRMAAAAGLAELGGGAMLAAGFFTPLAAAMIAGTMLVAARTAHAGKGPWISNGGWEHVLTLAVVAVGLAVIGAGAWSLDAAIGWDVSGLWWGVGALLVALVGATDVLTIGRRGRKAPRAASSLSHRPG